MSAEPVTRRVLERIREYVSVETPTGATEACRALAERMRADLERAGAADTRTIDAGDAGRHVLADFSGRESGEPLLVIGHLDTVHAAGTLERMPFRESAGRVHGPGIFDMKGPIALLVDVLGGMAASGRRPLRPVRLLITCDEETGSETSRGLIEETARAARAVLVPEPPMPGGAAKTSRKGVAIYQLDVHGVAAHAGIAPEEGASAVLELAAQIGAIAELADAEAGTTLNTGVIRGGSASNVVPAHAFAEIDVRFTEPSEGERIDRALRALEPHDPRVRLEVSGGVNRPPFVRTPQVAELYRRVAALAAADGLELGEGASGGGSDGSFTAALGVPTLDGLGLPGGGAHAADEHIEAAAIAPRHRLWTRILTEL